MADAQDQANPANAGANAAPAAPAAGANPPPVTNEQANQLINAPADTVAPPASVLFEIGDNVVSIINAMSAMSQREFDTSLKFYVSAANAHLLATVNGNVVTPRSKEQIKAAIDTNFEALLADGNCGYFLLDFSANLQEFAGVPVEVRMDSNLAISAQQMAHACSLLLMVCFVRGETCPAHCETVKVPITKFFASMADKKRIPELSLQRIYGTDYHGTQSLAGLSKASIFRVITGSPYAKSVASRLSHKGVGTRLTSVLSVVLLGVRDETAERSEDFNERYDTMYFCSQACTHESLMKIKNGLYSPAPVNEDPVGIFKKMYRGLHPFYPGYLQDSIAHEGTRDAVALIAGSFLAVTQRMKDADICRLLSSPPQTAKKGMSAYCLQANLSNVGSLDGAIGHVSAWLVAVVNSGEYAFRVIAAPEGNA